MGDLVNFIIIPEDIRTYLNPFKNDLNHLKIIYNHNKKYDNPYIQEYSLTILPKDKDEKNLLKSQKLLIKKIASVFYTQRFEGKIPTIKECCLTPKNELEVPIPLDHFIPFYEHTSACLFAQLDHFNSALRFYNPRFFDIEDKPIILSEHQKEIENGKGMFRKARIFNLEHILITKEGPVKDTEIAQNF